MTFINTIMISEGDIQLLKVESLAENISVA